MRRWGLKIIDKAMMSNQTDSNPLMRRLSTGQSKRALLICGGLATSIGAIGVPVAVMLDGPGPWRWFTQPIFVLLMIAIHIVVPIVVSITAILMMFDKVQKQEFEMLRLTNLPDKHIVTGYAMTVLYKTRYLLAILAGSGVILFVSYILQDGAVFLILTAIVSAWIIVYLAAVYGVQMGIEQKNLWDPLIGVPVQMLMFGGIHIFLISVMYETPLLILVWMSILALVVYAVQASTASLVRRPGL
jgi:hypothetical protein